MIKLSAKSDPECGVFPAIWHSDFWSGNHYIKIKIRRNSFIATCISLVIHGAILFAPSSLKLAAPRHAAKLPAKTINVRIAGLPAKNTSPKVFLKAIKQNKTPVKAKPKLRTPKLISVPKSSTVIPQKSIINSSSSAINNASSDFMSFIKAKRQRAQELADSNTNESSTANSRPLSPDELRDANIKRNLQTQGTRGIFEVVKKNIRTAQFSFKGWKNDYSIPHLEVIDVETGANGNINLSIVKEIIVIIRREYKGDFNWDSHRLNQVIVLSARIEDNAGLEEFLMKEFFSADGF